MGIWCLCDYFNQIVNQIKGKVKQLQKLKSDKDDDLQAITQKI